MWSVRRSSDTGSPHQRPLAVESGPLRPLPRGQVPGSAVVHDEQSLCSDRGERTRHIASPDLVHVGHRGSIGKPANQLAHEQVFADVDVPRPVRRTRAGAAVTVTAAIPGPAVYPVRVHTTPADPAPNEPREQVAAGSALPGLTGGTDMLGGDELRLGHQHGMSGPRRDCPLPHRHRPVTPTPGASPGLLLSAPHLPARVPRVAQDHGDGQQRRRSTVTVPVPPRIDL